MKFKLFLIPALMVLMMDSFGCQGPVRDASVKGSGASGDSGVRNASRRVTLKTVPYRPLGQLLPPEGYWDNPKYPELVKLTAAAGQDEPAIQPRQRWGQMVHRVRAGDTLHRIAKAYYGNDNWQSIYNNNRDALSSPGQLREGQLLYLPMNSLKNANGYTRPPGRRPDYYVVGKGDTLARIAKLFLGHAGLYPRITRLNNLTNPHQLRPGLMLNIPPVK